MFISYVKLLYTNITSSVINNGHCTETFKPERGIRQGCPASSNLFILCAELLSCNIRRNANIKGIEIAEYVYKIVQFADDKLIISRDLEGIKESLRVLKQFGRCSGLKVNKDKTKLVN